MVRMSSVLANYSTQDLQAGVWRELTFMYDVQYGTSISNKRQAAHDD